VVDARASDSDEASPGLQSMFQNRENSDNLPAVKQIYGWGRKYQSFSIY
jgi:hypothetical protein